MANYFRCKKSCSSHCCPDGGKPKLAVGATLGDIYRTYKFNNPENKAFSEITAEQFTFYACQPIDKHIESILEGKSPKPRNVFIITPVAKNKCTYFKNGCEAHNTILKYLVCTISPECQSIINDVSPMFHDCLYGKSLSQSTIKKVKSLAEICMREAKITAEVFPKIKLRAGDFMAIALSAFESCGFPEQIDETLKSFDREMPWENDIKETTRQYAQVLGTEFLYSLD